MQEIAHQIRAWLEDGRRVAVGRVVAIEGFSTWPGDEMLAVDEAGAIAGSILGATGTAQVRSAAEDLLRSGEPTRTVTVEIHGKAVIEAGLSCGGQASVLLQPASAIPSALWSALASRAPAALVTAADGAQSVVLAPSASGPRDATGTAGSPQAAGLPRPEGVERRVDPLLFAASVLAAGHSATRSLESDAGLVLVEAWVPPPRVVVVGSGDLVSALVAQSALLGWDARTVEAADALAAALDWAGATAALVVLSHDPHVDVPALRTGLDRQVPYVGAMGSRSTQSRRIERLTEAGVLPDSLGRIHRPIGLDLGGRSAPEIALAICAEILAARTGRDGGSLQDRTGPIHDRVSSTS